jgi:hypothetical protein
MRSEPASINEPGKRTHRGAALRPSLYDLSLRPLTICLLCLGLLLLAACEPSKRDITNTPEYKAGYESGYERGLNEGNDFKRGHAASREAGITEARPQHGRLG